MQKDNPNFAVKLSFAVLMMSLSSCLANDANAQGANQQTINSKDALESELEELLENQVSAWNDGNLEKFMDTYWKSPKLTFSSGGKTNFGWQATLDNYKKAYPTPEKMGKLHFDKLLVSRIEASSALVLGNWHLRLADGQERDGNFSLVIRKFGEHWKIIHDHSSELQKPTK
ncbi:MAG: DUF4440 domain-containing protein [Mariniblastus sp.]|nr:DUF4440 domain-containing protein [Mariniblastus sp.]MDG2183958.1 DUF4440 domain-containing protein [Mariniblastus sp.]